MQESSIAAYNYITNIELKRNVKNDTEHIDFSNGCNTPIEISSSVCIIIHINNHKPYAGVTSTG